MSSDHPPLPISVRSRAMNNRRKFLLQCSAVATVAAMPVGVGFCAPFKFREVPLDRIGFSTFSRLVGTHFIVYQGLAPIKLELVEAKADQGLGPRQLSHEHDPDVF